MRAYKVIATDGEFQLGFRFAGTSADARATRDQLVEKFDVKKKDVTIEDCEIPTAKAELLEFVNTLAVDQDAQEEGGEE